LSDTTPVVLQQEQDYRFTIRFGEGVPPLVADEAQPLGSGLGPTPGQLLVAAVGNCMSDSLLFALRKFKQSPEPLRTEGRAEIGRNEAGRLRVQTIHIHIHLGVPADSLLHLDRALAQFEDFCIVGSSVAQGIPVKVTVSDSLGTVLKSPS
jgi:uncharacterized OsmC-like protein